MTYPEWSEPVRLMEQHLGPATRDQQALAAEVGLALSGDLPHGVAAGMLEDHLLPRIWADPARGAAPATEKQVAFLENISDERPWKRPPLTKRVASAWIDHYLTMRNAQRLRVLKIGSGDKVTKTEAWVNHLTGELQTLATDHIVSSIGASGLVYFKGGNGQCAWLSALSRNDA